MQTQTAPEPAMPRGSLPAMLRRGLVNQLLCGLIALGFWASGPQHHGIWPTVLYTFTVGNLIWLGVDGGRQLMARLASKGPGRVWPGWLTMGPLVAIASVGGYSVGTSIVDALLGLQSPGLFASRGAGVVTLLVAAAVTYFFYSRERLHAERVAAEQARRLALENRLAMLEAQLEPHMLFNTLANLRVLIEIDPERAQAMLDRLIAFLRAVLGSARAPQHPLHAEFDRLADYLALMAVRMGERLEVRFELPPELRDCPIPPLLLQPLVENAIRHGLEPKVEGGRIEIGAARHGGRLRLTVRDNGVGFAATGVAGGGLGTTLVRERLAALHGDAARFELQPLAEGGTLAVVTLPPPTAATRETACHPPTAHPAH